MPLGPAPVTDVPLLHITPISLVLNVHWEFKSVGLTLKCRIECIKQDLRESGRLKMKPK